MASIYPGIHSGDHYAASADGVLATYSATMLLGSIILLMIVLVVGARLKGHRVGSISVCCVFSLRADKTVAVLLYRQLSGA